MLDEKERHGTQLYYLEDDLDKRIFLAKRKWVKGSRVMELQTQRTRVYVTD